MAFDPDANLPPPKHADIVLGQDLSALSEHELIARIAALEAEIGRCRVAVGQRQTTREAANAVFKTR